MPNQGESMLSRRIRAALNARGHRVWKNWGSQMVETGIPDLTGFAKDGRGIALEVKMKGKERSGLSTGQKRFLGDLIQRAPLGIVAVVTSVEEAIYCVEGGICLYSKQFEDGYCYMVPGDRLTVAEAERAAAAMRIWAENYTPE